MTKKEFTDKFYPVAKAISDKTKLSPYIILSQAYLESAGGESLLSKKYNNFFGMKKSPQWKGKTVLLNTKEVINKKQVTVKQEFKVYNNALESFYNYASLVTKSKRYIEQGILKTVDPFKQASAIVRGGYATDTNYLNKITNLINDFMEIPINPLINIGSLLLLSAALIIFAF